MLWELAGLAGCTVLVVTAGAAGALVSGHPGTTLLLLPMPVLMPWGTVRLMKRANRRAQRRLAAGEFTGLEKLDAVGSTSLTHGSTV